MPCNSYAGDNESIRNSILFITSFTKIGRSNKTSTVNIPSCDRPCRIITHGYIN